MEFVDLSGRQKPQIFMDLEPGAIPYRNTLIYLQDYYFRRFFTRWKAKSAVDSLIMHRHYCCLFIKGICGGIYSKIDLANIIA
jgi:hypothetical protein